MNIRKAVGLAAAGVLGAATVVLPAQAGSETTPGVTAENVGPGAHYWTPSTVTVAPGGAVEFSNPGEVPHGIQWISTPGGAPSCEGAVPVGTTESASGTKWKGDCSFTTPGTYTFYCTVHKAAMRGSVVVSAGGTTTTTTTPTTTGTTTTGTSTGTPNGGPGGSTGQPAPAALSAVKLAARHGGVVHGSLSVAQAAAGGTLTILLRARIAGRNSVVGRLTRTYINAGSQSWTITLSAPARRVLRRKHHLAVSAKLTLTPPGGSPSTLSRALTLHG